MKFRKRPVEVEAFKFENGKYGLVKEWCGGVLIGQPGRGGKIVGLLVKTLEGNMRADVGDWIIKGVHGEFYPCKPDIFSETYEPLTPEQESR